MLSAVWVSDDFKLPLRLALEFWAYNQTTRSTGQINESISRPKDKKDLRI